MTWRGRERGRLERARADRGAERPGRRARPVPVRRGPPEILFRSGGDLLWAWRPDTDAAFEAPEPPGDPVNLPDERDTDPHLSRDGSVLFFASTRTGVADLYEARRPAP